MTPVEKIKSLIHHLGYKDSKLAEKFIKERDFERVLELVDADIKILNKKIDTIGHSTIKDDEKIICLGELKGELISYLSLLGITVEYDSDEDDDEIDDDDDDDTNDIYY